LVKNAFASDASKKKTVPAKTAKAPKAAKDAEKVNADRCYLGF
jgi:hypothetical protein